MIRVEDVSKHYGSKQALNKVELHVPAGVCYGLIGPNGSGKSTLMKILAGVIREYEGKFIVPGSLGYVPQEISLEETLTAFDNLRFFGKIYGLTGAHLAGRIEAVLAAIGLKERATDKVNTFSGGMKRRLNIGCALLHEPEFVIMDEPTVGVDPQSRRHIFLLVEQLKRQGTTIIYTSHHMEEVESLCDDVAFIDRGKIVEQGSIDALLRRYAQSAVFIKGEGVVRDWFELVERVEEKDGGWLVHAEEPLETLKQLSMRCQEEKISPTQLGLVEARLEDIFFSLTGTDLRDSEGGDE
ncbi:ABC transporter ATP-binding protein [Shouchella lonarensis]|uniref:ABC-2 type transport system ATP-binding protein n=1 Tax=Shouchella lonarensis TaxID=1464122 RepID=A0A1G6MVR5_9BACI|nr:ABC transporter ATP-binding protein [Shouchella lonarensis]SDC59708.1 ABC-2 type transport system ATP-binding protein [Shouchella lonarensis]